VVIYLSHSLKSRSRFTSVVDEILRFRRHGEHGRFPGHGPWRHSQPAPARPCPCGPRSHRDRDRAPADVGLEPESDATTRSALVGFRYGAARCWLRKMPTEPSPGCAF